MANPGFIPMKAAQRFMRPVKEVREGFFTMADPGSTSINLGLSTAASSGLGVHQISATRHFEEQYYRCAEDAGLIESSSFTGSCFGSPRASTSRRYSRAATPRQIMGLGNNASDDEEESLLSASMSGSVRTAQTDVLLGSASLALHKPV